MLSPVVGFDVGSLTSFIGAAKGGGFEILANEFGDRRMPSCVAFNGKARLLGSAAEQQMATNVANTITSFSRLIGKMENDPVVNFEREHTFFRIVSDSQGRAAVQVKVNGEPMVLLPEQILAMHLHKLALITESNLGTKVVDVVLSVPSYYTDRERGAFLDAARIAGLNCMRLVNETTAIGIAYGLTKKDLPAVGQPSRNVAFVSLGNSNLQVVIVAFNAGKMRVISTAWDPCLGGRDFDMCIFKHLVKEIEEKYNLKVMSNAKACVRLLKSCERLKKIMSTNSTEIPINVECLMEDTDISLKMKREFFEEICRPLLLRVKQTMEKALALSTLKLGDLYSVELVGGGTRIPAVKTLVREVFGKEGSTTLNADEAVARGCALQAAICSPSFKVREFSIVDACPYSISLHWKPTDGVVEVERDEDAGEVAKDNSCEIFKHLSSVPASKKLTFYRKSDFALTASYSHPEGLHIGDSRIGSFLITDIVPTPPDNCCQVRIKARVNSNGIFTICNACVMERVEKEVEVAIEDPKPESSTVANAIETEMETETQPSKTEGGVDQPPTGGAASGATETAVANQSPSQPKTRIEKKFVLRPRDVAVEATTFQLPHAQLVEFTEFQARLNQSDKLERDRQHLMNELASYAYEMQRKLETCLQQYTTKRERDSFNKALTDTRIGSTMRQIGDRYYLRFTEADSRSSAINALANSCEGVRKVVESYLAGDPRYSHLSKKDMAKVDNTLKDMQHRLNTFMDGVKNLHPTSDPTIFVADLYDAQKKLEEICNPIILKPKPAPPPAPPKPASPGSDKLTSVPDGDIGSGVRIQRNNSTTGEGPTRSNSICP
ncbi:Heat shock 70 kDa protein 4 [Echinococcus multilocularis]|uniref:Heat shock 70 kDa protein 4 n=1 Tax=Echinococcus multilocularis TaxID=6211 RepID=A0A068Y9P6_ECHMU|nr:Heat shock 70 kDa protein 4 [Echinococcus multilocularis]